MCAAFLVPFGLFSSLTDGRYSTPSGVMLDDTRIRSRAVVEDAEGLVSLKKDSAVKRPSAYTTVLHCHGCCIFHEAILVFHSSNSTHDTVYGRLTAAAVAQPPFVVYVGSIDEFFEIVVYFVPSFRVMTSSSSWGQSRRVGCWWIQRVGG